MEAIPLSGYLKRRHRTEEWGRDWTELFLKWRNTQEVCGWDQAGSNGVESLVLDSGRMTAMERGEKERKEERGKERIFSDHHYSFRKRRPTLNLTRLAHLLNSFLQCSVVRLWFWENDPFAEWNVAFVHEVPRGAKLLSSELKTEMSPESLCRCGGLKLFLCEGKAKRYCRHVSLF